MRGFFSSRFPDKEEVVLLQPTVQQQQQKIFVYLRTDWL